MTRRFLATMRASFHAEDEVEARLIANEIEEAVSTILDEGDTLDITQIIPVDLQDQIEPTEVVNQLRLTVDMLIKTRIIQCYESARELHKIAWILEHRREDSFDLTAYDYTEFFERADMLLGRTKGERT